MAEKIGPPKKQEERAATFPEESTKLDKTRKVDRSTFGKVRSPLKPIKRTRTWTFLESDDWKVVVRQLANIFNSYAIKAEDKEQAILELLNQTGFGAAFLKVATEAPPELPTQETPTLTTEPQEADLPTQAPALWLERQNRNETPPEFIKREYAPWLGRGLTQAHIRRLDKSLYMALHKWLHSHDWPADLDLPTRKELNDRQLAAAGLPADPAQADARSREHMRLNAMAQARLFRADRR